MALTRRYKGMKLVISACRGEWKEAGTYLVCALPLIGDLLGKGWKWMASTGIDSALKIANKGDDILDTLKVSYRAASDKAAELRKYLDDAVGEMFAGGSSCRLAVADGIYLDNSSRMMVEIYDETGELTQFARRLDEAGELPQMAREAENVSELPQMAREAGEVPYNHGGTGGSGSALEGGSKTISYTDFDSVYQRSIHNPNAEKIMHGKYDGGGPTSYITKA